MVSVSTVIKNMNKERFKKILMTYYEPQVEHASSAWPPRLRNDRAAATSGTNTGDRIQ